jgi:ketosteroid isomerase-like protein
MDDQAIAAVRELEEARCRALVAEDRPALRRLFADSLVYTHSTGRFDDKESYLRQKSSGGRYVSMRRDDARYVAHGDAVFCTGVVTADIARAGAPTLTWKARYSNVWVKTDHGWQMALWQATTLPSSEYQTSSAPQRGGT